MKFEFVQYDDMGNLLGTDTYDCRNESSARSRAGKYAKRNGGPCDVAYFDDGLDWNARYVTTVSPSEYHASGYRCERLV